ncbi:MAG: SPOR domain-containing protein [Terracidiphilus sp.]|jgi:cell division septation protein DedD
MRGVLNDREVQPAETRHDTELTLGSTTLLLIFFGLVLLCGLCFGLGYATGHRGTPETAVLQPAANGQSPATQAASEQPKPAAEQPAANSEPPSDQPVDNQLSNALEASAQTSSAAPSASTSSTTQQVKPAFTSATNPLQAAQLAASTEAPAPATAGSVMVQIAAVSQQEDADVLMSALRKRGYAVASRREPLDGLIHVRIGPFKTRDEAETWRQKLLSDGYNAIVQP